MRDRLLVYVAMLAFCGWHWARLERPRVSPAEMVFLGVAGDGAARWSRRCGRTRLALTRGAPGLGGARASARAAASGRGSSATGSTRSTSATWCPRGRRGFLNTTTPIDAGRFQQTDDLVDLAFVGLAMLMAWPAAGAAPAAAGVAGGLRHLRDPLDGLLIGSDGVRAAIFLALVLLTLVVCRDGHASVRGGRTVAQVLVLGTLAVVGAVIVGEAPGVSKAAFLNWQSWNPLADAAPRVSVGYVWNQDYGPLHWPKKTTQVFQVTTPRPLYWKAATLNEFVDDHWSSSPIVERFFRRHAQVEPPASMLPPEGPAPRPRTTS